MTPCTVVRDGLQSMPTSSTAASRQDIDAEPACSAREVGFGVVAAVPVAAVPAEAVALLRGSARPWADGR